VLVTPVALTPLDGPPRQTRVQVLWQTPATTALVVPRPTTHARVRTPLEVVDAIATLATGRTDDAMAAVRKAQGLRSGRHQPRTPDAVAWIRYTDHLRKPGSEPPMAARLDARPDGRDSTRALAMPLGVTSSTVHDWRKHGTHAGPPRDSRRTVVAHRDSCSARGAAPAHAPRLPPHGRSWDPERSLKEVHDAHTVGIPNGRSVPLGLGRYTRRHGWWRYPRRLSDRTAASASCGVFQTTPSTPGERRPRLVITRRTAKALA
jgi:hypothetical protein